MVSRKKKQSNQDFPCGCECCETWTKLHKEHVEMSDEIEKEESDLITEALLVCFQRDGYERFIKYCVEKMK